MAADSHDMPPVRLLPDTDLARLALGAPLFERAVRLARWAVPNVRINAAAELVADDLTCATAELGLTDEPEGTADTADAWALAVDTGLVEVELPEDAAKAADLDEPAGTAAPGKGLELLDSGDPGDVIGLWRSGLEAVLDEAATSGLADFIDEAVAEGPEDGGRGFAPEGLEWDPEEEAAFLDGALVNLYLLSALEELDGRRDGDVSSAGVPLPVLAASMVVPDEMEVPTDAVLEEVSEAMMRLDDHFRMLAPTGLVEYRPVDDALITEDDAPPAATDPAALPRGLGGPADFEDMGELGDVSELGEEEVARYGMVLLTPLGVAGVRERLREAGVRVPVVGDLAGQDADALLAALVVYPEAAAAEESALWLAGRQSVEAARELLAAARGADPEAPARRLACQQTLGRLGMEAEPALREVLDDRELGGLARVWLTERGAADVPAPDAAMVFWLTIDTLAAQLDVDDDAELLRELVSDLVARHDRFFDEAWRVDHPATADVLEAMGRLHPDRKTAKEARKAAFKARSGAGA
ncbi:hypothetical protein NGB36_23215 [Streptomyces sp. RB6PN25]|uniref:Uncharacterized protein n=1 Tax=Streptomyces humicola TaxID=2953240 RepID=A0ABT1Q3S8_9ACTN|nr:hypothetical protein [Streptomyces humicola]MCQ4083435.1 hypothetical protein [Streptomyces humicola]